MDKLLKTKVFSILFFIVIFACSFLMVGSVYDGNKAIGAEEKILKLGSVLPLSGAAAPWGIPWQRTAIMLSDEWNEKGGLPVGNEKYKIEWKWEDDKYKGEEGRMAAEKLIFRDKVKFIFGPISSASYFALRDLLEPNKVIAFINTYARESLGKQWPWTFRVLVTAEEKGPVIYKEVLGRNPGIKKVSLINRDDETGWAGDNLSKRLAKFHKLEVVASEFYPTGMKDFSPLVTRMLAKKPDLIDLSNTSAGDQAAIIKQAREMGYKGRVMSFPMAPIETLLKVAGKDFIEGYYTEAFAAPLLPPGHEEFKERYTKRWGQWVEYAFQASPYGQFVLEAIRSAGSVDSQVVRDHLAKGEWSYKAIDGERRLGGEKYYGVPHQIYCTMIFSEVRDGKYVGLKKYEVNDILKLVKEFNDAIPYTPSKR